MYRVAAFRHGIHGKYFFPRLGQVACASSVASHSVASVLSDTSSFVGKKVTIGGWVRAARKQKNMTFIDIADGSCSNRLQVIATSEDCFVANPSSLKYHSCVEVEGTVAESTHKSNQEVEVIADRIVVLAACQDTMPSGQSYPFRPREKYQSEYIRKFPMFRAKLDDFAALLRVRNGERRWFKLKDKTLKQKAKGEDAEILLEMNLLWNP